MNGFQHARQEPRVSFFTTLGAVLAGFIVTVMMAFMLGALAGVTWWGFHVITGWLVD